MTIDVIKKIVWKGKNKTAVILGRKYIEIWIFFENDVGGGGIWIEVNFALVLLCSYLDKVCQVLHTIIYLKPSLLSN